MNFVRVRVLLILFAAFLLTGTVIVAGPVLSRAQTADTSADTSSSSSGSSDIATERAQLQNELNDIDGEIAQTQSTLTTLGTQGKSLQNSIATLTAQIKQDQLQLQATQVQIQALQSDIVVHNTTITTLSGKLSDEQQSLAEIIRQTNEIDNYSLVELVLSSQDVSGFFGDLDSFTELKEDLGVSYAQTTDTETQTETEKQQLQTQQTQQEQLDQEETLEEQQIQSAEQQKQKLLDQNQSEETDYQSTLGDEQQSAAQIREELFALAGGSGQISLPTAISLAQTAGQDTGVDPALILGILKQETNIGQNVGTANYLDAMNPTRDVPEFLFLTNLLGIDPNSVKVSAAPSYGWGGAMGPAQFIPSTWACYAGIINTQTGTCGPDSNGTTYQGPWQYVASKDRIAKLAGHPSTPSNPWDNLDAFVAVGLLMSDNGAPSDIGSNPGCPSSGCEAALRYFAGWGNADDPAYAFYGEDVMAFAAQFKSDITTLGSSGSS